MLRSGVVAIAALFACAHGAKILGIFPLPSQSHVLLGSALLKELAKRGHDVTMISSYPVKNPPSNYHDIELKGFIERKDVFIKESVKPDQKFYYIFKIWYGIYSMMNRDVLEYQDVKTLLESGEKYDLVIQFWGFCTESLLGIGHTLNATTIGFLPTGLLPMVNYLSGNSAPYAYVPHLFLPLTDDMTFFQRVLNTVGHIATDIIYYAVLKQQETIYNEHFPTGPPLWQLIDNVDLVLINSHYTTESPRPYLPNLIQIGGFYMEESQELPEELEKYLNSSKHGVIYFSLGSNIKSADLPAETLQVLFESFRKVKFDILWKFETTLEGAPKNVKVLKWLPQKAILKHPNIKAFITHGGLGSTVESTYYGVPMVCIPMFADQEKNAADSEAKGYAITIRKYEITVTNVVNALNEITKPQYKEKIVERSDLLRNKEINPMEKAVYWVEHAIKYKGAKHLKAKSSQLPWYQYFLLDVIAFILTVTVLLLYVIKFVFKKLFSLCFRRQKNKSEKIKRQ